MIETDDEPKVTRISFESFLGIEIERVETSYQSMMEASVSDKRVYRYVWKVSITGRKVAEYLNKSDAMDKARVLIKETEELIERHRVTL